MQRLDLTLDTAAENLALDEALLEEAESGGPSRETLRLWEPRAPLVIVGRSSRVNDEVRREACRALGVPVLRRPSGGAAVVAGPGCLMYSLVLDLDRRPALRAMDRAHRFVLDAMVASLAPLAPQIRCRGTSDLALGLQKVSGNSVRVRRRRMLYHGTLLYDFPLELIERLLAMPPRQPEYRQGRRHAAFVANLPATALQLRDALASAWDARQPRADWPQELTARLVAEKYACAAWHVGEQGFGDLGI